MDLILGTRQNSYGTKPLTGVGAGLAVGAPVPNSPHAWRSPAASITNASVLRIAVGTRRSVVVPPPNCPSWPRPQQKARPDRFRAHVYAPPAATAAHSSLVVTAPGRMCCRFEPSPNCPLVFRPQQ